MLIFNTSANLSASIVKLPTSLNEKSYNKEFALKRKDKSPF
ncbi:hypothetical protein [Helicobacter pylori]